MRSWVLAISLCVSAGVQAATWSGRVLHRGAPVPGAQVRVFERFKLLAGCKSASQPSLLGRCLCPGEREAFTARAMAGLESPRPLASVTTGPDGGFSVSVEGAGPFAAHVTSADGALGATVSDTAAPEASEVFLAPLAVSQIRVAGGAGTSAVYGLNPYTGELDRFTLRDGVWVGPPLPTQVQDLVVAAPGAVPIMTMLWEGRVKLGQAGRPTDSPETVKLDPPEVMRGVVTLRGRPLPGVEVVADPDVCALRATTNAKGEFAMPSVATGSQVIPVTARAGGRFATAQGGPRRRVELALVPAARLEVTAVDTAGAPVAGLWLAARAEEPVSRWLPPTDAAGRWVQEDLTEGTVELSVLPPYVLLSQPTITLAGVTRVRAVVARGASIRGQVLDARGLPVAGAHVTASPAETTQPRPSAAMKDFLRRLPGNTDAEGFFQLGALLPGEYALVGWHSTAGVGSARARAPGKVELRLGGFFQLGGRVVDTSGAPVANARIAIRVRGEREELDGAVTGPDGRFRAALEVPGPFELTAARRKGDTPSPPQRVEVPGDTLEFVLPAVESLRGTVVDASGQPRGGVVVQAVATQLPQWSAMAQRAQELDLEAFAAMAKAMRQHHEATTAPDGSFTIPLSSPALVFAEGAGQRTEPVMATPQAPVQLVLGPRARATGRVLDWNAKPVSRFSINGKWFDSPEGRFEVLLPARGLARLRIDAAPAPYTTREVEVPATPTEVRLGDLRLAQGFNVAGRILSARTYRPIPEAAFDATSAGGEFDVGAVQPDGSFILTRVPRGELTIVARAGGYLAKQVTVEVKPGQPVHVLELEQPAVLEVTVLKNGVLLKGVEVEVTRPSAAPELVDRRTGRTSAQGLAIIDQLHAGEWTVKVGAATRTVRLGAGQFARLVLSVR